MPLGIGILGAAKIAKKNCRAISLSEGKAEVVAVGSRDISKANDFIDSCKLQRAKAYGSYDEVIKDTRVEAVYIPLPTSIHLEWIRNAAHAGKHILLEKPICMTTDEITELQHIVTSSGIQFMDGTMWLHNPRTDLIRKSLYDKNILGSVRHIMASFFMDLLSISAENIRFDPELDGLGCIGDLAWYTIGFSLFAAHYQCPEYVIAYPSALFNELGVPMVAGGTLVWRDGLRADVMSSFASGVVQEARIIGSKGTMSIDDFVVPVDEKLSSYIVNKKWASNPYGAGFSFEHSTEKIETPIPQEAIMWKDFADAVNRVKEGGEVETSWMKISALTQRVVLSLLRSAQLGGQSVRVQ